jgi:hypothetical protein
LNKDLKKKCHPKNNKYVRGERPQRVERKEKTSNSYYKIKIIIITADAPGKKFPLFVWQS